MRLLHTTELRFEEFFDDKIPVYAILSHRWDADEVSYQDFLAGRKKHTTGYAKIVACCSHAAGQTWTERKYRPDLFDYEGITRAIDWVWIDTCCINKESSAELSEAINSMYRWYADAHVCYVYLSDVLIHRNLAETTSDLQKSKWFTRGWTLQELLAPFGLVFLDRKWRKIGTRSDFRNVISQVTGIAERHFKDLNGPFIPSASIIEKFSWAARRSTSRREDRAYCLLGLFSISMPLLYGEGDNAFRRLLQEIVRSSNDESAFLWDHYINHQSGILSVNPWLGPSWRFEASEDAQPGECSSFEGITRPPYAVTNQGLELRVPKALAQKSEFLLPLNCVHYERGAHARRPFKNKWADPRGAYAIRLTKDKDGGGWRRSFFQSWSEGLPELNGQVFRLPDSNALFIVPRAWVWNREELERKESDIIYVSLFGGETLTPRGVWEWIKRFNAFREEAR
jgi:hypothetical protein